MLICIAFLAYKKQIKIYHFIPLIFSGAETFFLFNAPGMKERVLMEAEDSPRFFNMSLPEKIACGLSNFFAFEFLTSVVVFGLFSCLLIFLLRESGKDLFKKTGLVYAVSCAAICVAANLLYIILKRKLPDKGFEHIFQSGNFGISEAVLFGLCVVLLIEVFAMILLLYRSNKKAGAAVAVCFSAALCSGMVLGFSSSVYESGQRVFFFSEIFMLIASSIMYTTLKNEKSKKIILNAAQAAAIITLYINCFSFCFMETPIMG